MNEKISKAHENIEGTQVARMIIDFHQHFRDVYGSDVMASPLCAVGPLQSLIGLAIENNLLTLPEKKDK